MIRSPTLMEVAGAGGFETRRSRLRLWGGRLWWVSGLWSKWVLKMEFGVIGYWVRWRSYGVLASPLMVEKPSVAKDESREPSVTKDESRLTKWMIPKIYFSLMDSFRGNSHLTSVF